MLLCSSREIVSLQQKILPGLQFIILDRMSLISPDNTFKTATSGPPTIHLLTVKSPPIWSGSSSTPTIDCGSCRPSAFCWPNYRIFLQVIQKFLCTLISCGQNVQEMMYYNCLVKCPRNVFRKTMTFFYPYQKAEIKKEKYFFGNIYKQLLIRRVSCTTVTCKNYWYLGVEVDRLHVPDFVKGAL
jgi:hypothetical protein